MMKPLFYLMSFFVLSGHVLAELPGRTKASTDSPQNIDPNAPDAEGIYPNLAKHSHTTDRVSIQIMADIEILPGERIGHLGGFPCDLILKEASSLSRKISKGRIFMLDLTTKRTAAGLQTFALKELSRDGKTIPSDPLRELVCTNGTLYDELTFEFKQAGKGDQWPFKLIQTPKINAPAVEAKSPADKNSADEFERSHGT